MKTVKIKKTFKILPFFLLVLALSISPINSEKNQTPEEQWKTKQLDPVKREPVRIVDFKFHKSNKPEEELESATNLEIHETPLEPLVEIRENEKSEDNLKPRRQNNP